MGLLISQEEDRMRGSTFLAIAAVVFGMYYFSEGAPYLARTYAYPLEHRAEV